MPLWNLIPSARHDAAGRERRAREGADIIDTPQGICAEQPVYAAFSIRGSECRFI